MTDHEINDIIGAAYAYATNGDDNPALPHIEALIRAVNDVRNRLATAEADADHGWSWATDRGLESLAAVNEYRSDLAAHVQAVAQREQP